jgi:ABC-type uncharacterized transport system substrate-binding protein
VVRRLLVALGLVATWLAPARGDVVLVGSERGAEHRETIVAARQTAPGFSFADEDSPDAAEQLRHAEVILAVGARALTLARAVAPDKPTVYAMVPAAEVQPGRNVTGVALEVPAYAEFAQWKQLRFDGQRVGVVLEKPSAAQLADVSRAGAALGLSVTARRVYSAEGVAAAVDELAPHVDAVWIVATPPPATLAKWSGRVALLGSDDKATEGGALFSLAPDARDIGRRAARLALGIAGRAPAQRLPVPAPATSTGALSLNATTAQTLGLELPDGILHKARKVFH